MGDPAKAKELKASDVINVNVGVMGHVDSGKTSLVAALSTHLSTAALDKHPESKRRGITLDLGFSSYLTELPERLKSGAVEYAASEGLPSPPSRLQFTLVDCPGHASLIRTIIGGAQIIDMIVLVADVTKGFQTQTAECLVIGEITAEQLVVVLNKTDLLPEDKRAEKTAKMSAKVRKILSSTRFAEAAIVALSAAPGGAGKGGAGAAADAAAASAKAASPGDMGSPTPLADVSSLSSLLLSSIRVPRRARTGPFLMAADHCFAVKGHGTVLTGTALRGRVTVGDEVEVVHLKQTKKVKSMQMFRKPVRGAAAGDRLGLCVAGLDPAGLERAVVATPGSVRQADRLLALVQRVRFYKGSCTSGARFHLTVGHATVMGTATFFGAMELAAAGVGQDEGSRALAAAERASAVALEDGEGAGAGDGTGDGAGDVASSGADARASEGAASSVDEASGSALGPSDLSHGLQVPELSYDWGALFEWQEELMGPQSDGKKKKREGKTKEGKETGKGASKGKSGSKAKSKSKSKPKGSAASATASSSLAPEHSPRWQWVLLELDSPVVCPEGSTVIGSRLDGDTHAPGCRLAFHGAVRAELPTASAGSGAAGGGVATGGRAGHGSASSSSVDRKSSLGAVRLYRKKGKDGAVDRVAEGGDGRSGATVLIARGLFGKGTELAPFLGLKVQLLGGEGEGGTGAGAVDGGIRGVAAAGGASSMEETQGGGAAVVATGVIEGGFGKSGKVRIRFRQPGLSVSAGQKLWMPFYKLVFGDAASRGKLHQLPDT